MKIYSDANKLLGDLEKLKGWTFFPYDAPGDRMIGFVALHTGRTEPYYLDLRSKDLVVNPLLVSPHDRSRVARMLSLGVPISEFSGKLKELEEKLKDTEEEFFLGLS